MSVDAGTLARALQLEGQIRDATIESAARLVGEQQARSEVNADECSVGGCEEPSAATITFWGAPFRMCREHAEQVEAALAKRRGDA